MDLVSELNRFISVYGFRPRKKLSQFFLISEKVIEEMVGFAELTPEDRVLEIGAGTGFISREILKKCPLTAVELDKALALLLEKELPQKNLEVIQGNFLELGLKEKKFSKIISAIPYHLSSQIVFKLLSLDFKRAVLLFQKEFADKLTAKPFYKNYSAITVLANHFFEARKKGVIPSSAFFPKPNCFSSIVVLDSKKQQARLQEQEPFIKFVKTLFRFRNKNLGNALKTSFQFLEKELELSEEDFLKKTKTLELKDERVCGLEGKDFLAALTELRSSVEILYK